MFIYVYVGPPSMEPLKLYNAFLSCAQSIHTRFVLFTVT